MGLLYRPELEKDNPIAPPAYLGPRRRLALARAMANEEASPPVSPGKTGRSRRRASGSSPRARS